MTKRKLKDRQKEADLDYLVYPGWDDLTRVCSRTGECPYRLAASIYHCIAYDNVSNDQFDKAKRFYNERI